MQSENWISNWNLKTQKNPNITKKIQKNPKKFFSLFYGLWGLKSSGIARAFIFCDKISRFLAILAFLYRGRYFFFNFFAISAKVWLFLPFFLSLVKRTITLVVIFFFKFPKASPYYRGKKLVEFDLDLLEITQISNFCNFLAISLQNSPFFFLPSSLSSIER